MPNTPGSILSNATGQLNTSGSGWVAAWTLTNPVTFKKFQIINDGASTGAARVSFGDRTNPVYVPAGGSVTLDDFMAPNGIIEAMRDASTDIVNLKLQGWKKGGETIATT